MFKRSTIGGLLFGVLGLMTAAAQDGDVQYRGLIKNRGSEKCMDAQGMSNRDGALLIQWDCHGKPNQQWEVVRLRGGEYAIRNVGSGLVLDVADNNRNSGAKIIQYRWNGGDNQRWRGSGANSNFELINKATGKCLDVKDGSRDNDAQIIQWDCHGRPNQRWHLGFQTTGGGNSGGGNWGNANSGNSGGGNWGSSGSNSGGSWGGSGGNWGNSGGNWGGNAVGNYPRVRVDTSGRGSFDGRGIGNRSVDRGYLDTQAGRVTVGVSGRDGFRVMLYGEVVEVNDRTLIIRVNDSDRGRTRGRVEVRLNRDRNEVEMINFDGQDFRGNFNR
jgi:hypothetical protein